MCKAHLRLSVQTNAPHADDGRRVLESEDAGVDLGWLDVGIGHGWGEGQRQVDLVTGDDEGAAVSKEGWAPHVFLRHSVTSAKLHQLYEQRWRDQQQEKAREEWGEGEMAPNDRLTTGPTRS